MDDRLLTLVLIQLFIAFNLSVGQRYTTLRVTLTPTPPTITVPAFVNCTQFSTPGENWVTFTYNGVKSDHCYLYSVFSDDSYEYEYSWQNAYDQCRDRKASLVSIHSNTENYILSHPLKLNGYSGGTFWTGLTSLNTRRGVYEWSDGTPLELFKYAPTTSSGDALPRDVRDQGRCVSMRVSPKNNTGQNYNDTGLWFRDDCDKTSKYICKKNTAGRPVSTQTPPPPVGNCAPDWFQYANQKCIKYINGSMTFNQSRDLCLKKYGGEMLAIHSEEEQNFITSYTAGLPSPFIGLIRRNYDKYWFWDGGKLTDFTNWGLGDNFYSNKLCSSIVTNYTQPGKWMQANCSQAHSVICEKALDPSLTTPGLTYASTKCKIPGFENFIQYRNSCYSILDSNPSKFLSYYGAEGSCQAMNNSHLVSIVDPFEEAFLSYYIKQYGKSDMYWIGLQSKVWSDTNISQVFEWTDEWPVYYTNWDIYEPQFAGLPQGECVTFAKSNGTWRTTTCDSGLAYICKTTSNSLPKLNSDKSGVCPTLGNATDKLSQWVDLDRRSQYCYWFSNEGNNTFSDGFESWTDASFHCRRRNGTLVSIHSNHDSLLLKSKLLKIGSDYNTWIGLSKDPKGDYRWEDGSALQYTNWDPNESIVSNTDIMKEGSKRQCVEVKSTNAMWKQQPCSGNKRNYYICETRKIYHAHGSTQNPNPSSKRTSNQSPSGSITSHDITKPTKHPDQNSSPGAFTKEQHGNPGMSAGAKAGVSISIVGGVVGLLAIGYFAFKRLRSNSPISSTFENRIYMSRRNINQGSEPGVRFTNRH